MARNFRKFFCKVNRFGRDNRFGNGANRFGGGRGNYFRNKGGESSKQKGFFYNCGVERHFASECTKPKESNAFSKRAWSNSEDGDEPQRMQHVSWQSTPKRCVLNVIYYRTIGQLDYG
ncbi:hypothetical protein Tco_1160362 [Tanacetum coccineum]